MNYSNENNFGKYLHHLDKLTTKVSKQPVNKIKQEMKVLQRVPIPSEEKRMIKQMLYNKLTPRKQIKLYSSFGQVAPATAASLAATQSLASQSVAPTTAASLAATQSLAATPISRTSYRSLFSTSYLSIFNPFWSSWSNWGNSSYNRL